MTTQSYLLSAVMLCLFATLSVSRADTFIETHSGRECVQLNTATPSIYYSDHGAFNNATAPVTFVCPLNNTRFLQVGDAPGPMYSQAYWWVSADDHNTVSNIRCQLQSCTSSASCLLSVSSTSRNTGSEQTFGNLGSPFGLGVYSNVLSLRCTMPGKAGSMRSGVRAYSLYAWE